MKTKTLLLLLTLLSSFLFAQQKYENKSRFTLGVTLNPGMSFKLFPNDYQSFNTRLESNFIDKPHFTIAGGVRMIYNFSECHSLELTTLIIDKSYKAPLSIQSGFEEYDIYNPSFMLDFPLMYRYQLNKNGFVNYIISGGVGLSIPIYTGGGYNWLPSANGDTAFIVQDQYYKSFLCNAYFAVKANIKIKNTRFEFGPNFQIALISYTNERETIDWNNELIPVFNSENKFYPYFVGLEMTVYLQKEK